MSEIKPGDYVWVTRGTPAELGVVDGPVEALPGCVASGSYWVQFGQGLGPGGRRGRGARESYAPEHLKVIPAGWVLLASLLCEHGRVQAVWLEYYEDPHLYERVTITCALDNGDPRFPTELRVDSNGMYMNGYVPLDGAGVVELILALEKPLDFAGWFGPALCEEDDGGGHHRTNVGPEFDWDYLDRVRTEFLSGRGSL